MKKLTFSTLLSLTLIALVVGQVAARAFVPVLEADLDGDSDVETVQQAPGPVAMWLFQTVDADKDGDADLVWTRGVPAVLCNLDADRLFEAVIQDAGLTKAWVAYPIKPSPADSFDGHALVFVRGQVLYCLTSAKDSVLYVSDPYYSGKADIDGDGSVDIIWQNSPTND